MKTNTFAAMLPVTAENIADLMIAALEGGSNYWLAAIRVVGPGTDTDPKQPGFWNDPDNDGDCLKAEEFWKTAQFPLTLVGMLSEEPAGEDVVTRVVTDEVLSAALTYYCKSRNFEDYDAFDADVFLQHLLLGEITYG